jgi:thioredoxin-like negative regulator of GroEL
MTVALTAARAIPDLERDRARAPRDTSVLYDLATVYALTQQYEKSRETLAELQRVAPAHAGARELLQRLPP